MSVKAIDFKPDRAARPRLSLVTSSKEPRLETLLRSRALDGPLKGAAISAPFNWDGVCRPGEGKPPYPGRYVWKKERWMWKEKKDA